MIIYNQLLSTWSESLHFIKEYWFAYDRTNASSALCITVSLFRWYVFVYKKKEKNQWYSSTQRVERWGWYNLWAGVMSVASTYCWERGRVDNPIKSCQNTIIKSCHLKYFCPLCKHMLEQFLHALMCLKIT